jgi:hypothetical protein
MNPIIAVRRGVDITLVGTARSTQALVIEGVARLVGTQPGRPLAPTELLRRLHREIWTLLVDDPAKFVDDSYDLALRLLALHREFAQRLFDVLDPEADASETPAEPDLGRVLAFPTGEVKRAQT